MTKRLFALGKYSRFVRPGWVRIGVNGCAVSAYATTDTALGAIGTDGYLSLWPVPKQAPASIPMPQGRFTAPITYGVTTFVGKTNQPASPRSSIDAARSLHAPCV